MIRLLVYKVVLCVCSAYVLGSAVTPWQQNVSFLPVVARQVDRELELPIRAAFYYPWFPEAWSQNGQEPYTHYTPSLGYYDSSDPTVIRQHIAAMQYGHIEAGILSWWGQGHHTDNRVGPILAATAGTDFYWALYYERENAGDPTVAE